jgi:hypothetical protein
MNVSKNDIVAGLRGNVVSTTSLNGPVSNGCTALPPAM